MQFDDRLKTAITQPVVDQHDRTVRWRQIIDLLARLPADHDEAIAEAAFALVEREAPAIPETVRAAAARNIANRSTDYRVVALFAHDTLAVAAPILASANLSASEWYEIGRDCSPEVAKFVRALNAAGAPAPRVEQAGPRVTVPDTTPVTVEEPPSISQMVARIEQLRSKRDLPPPVPEPARVDAVPPAQRSDPPRREPDAARPLKDGMFRWESDAEGRISWVDGAPRGALVGQVIEEAECEAAVGHAMANREPFLGARMHLEMPAVAGDWKLSGIPAFSPVDGRFLGYRGVAHKPEVVVAKVRSPAPRERRAPGPKDLDALRETIHEIKTPLNAIIGFAEIIDGQYLGPAHRNYRQRAAEIVAQARMLLEAVYDLETASRLRPDEGANDVTRLADLFLQLAPELEQAALRRDATLSIVTPARDQRWALGEELSLRLMRRFLGAVVAAGGPGDRFVITVGQHAGAAAVEINRPASTSSLGTSILLDPAFDADGQSDHLLGLGFALRLVRGLVRVVNGDLTIDDQKFALVLPSA